MLASQFRIFLRHLRRKPVFGFINIFGLAAGMAACLLIVLFLHREASFEEMHPDRDRIVRVLTIDTALGTNNQRVGITQPAVGANIADAIPEVEAAVRLTFQNQVLLRRGTDQPVYAERLRNADPNFFEFFDFPVVAGDRATALEEPYSLVLTESLARQLFGDENPVGQSLRDGSGTDFTVTAVLEDLPENTHLDFDALGSMNTVAAQARANQPEGSTNPIWIESWNMVAMPTYAKLEQGVEFEGLDERVTQFTRDAGVGENFSITLQPLTDVHLGSTDVIFDPVQNKGDRGTVVIFAAIAALILLIAIVNYLNLSTARSAERAREVGIRKAVGSTRQQLMRQFMSESVFTAMAALVLAMGMALAGLPLLGNLLGIELGLSSENLPMLGALSLLLVALAGGLGGLYPAFALSGFKPIAVLKGKFVTSRSGQQLRIGLVVFQFALSIALIASTIIVQKQLRFIQERDMGYDREQVLLFDMTDQTMGQSQETFRDELRAHSAFSAVSATGDVPGRTFGRTGLQPEGVPDDDVWIWSVMQASPSTLPALGIEMAEGRNFDADRPADEQGVVIINETAVRQLGWDNPLERRIFFGQQDTLGSQVIGVAADFNFAGIHQNIEPLVIFPMANNPGPTVVARVLPGRMDDALAAAQAAWSATYPDYPFEYSFMDEEFQQIYARDQTTGRVVNIFSILAILIACLGLFGLASHATAQRTKEIGIRKVLGASAQSVMNLLVFDFARWVLVANLFAWPLAWFAATSWLEGFAYQVEIGIWSFVFASVVALVIFVVTVLSQTWSAARMNPARALRYE